MIVSSKKLLSLSENLEFKSHLLENHRDTKINRMVNERLENSNFGEVRDSIKINSAREVNQGRFNWVQFEILNQTNDQHQQLPAKEKLTTKMNGVDKEEEKENVDPTLKRTYVFQNVIEKIAKYVTFIFNFLFKVSSEFIRCTAKFTMDAACCSFRLANELTFIKTLVLNLHFGRPSDHIQNQVITHNHTHNHTHITQIINTHCQFCGHSSLTDHDKSSIKGTIAPITVC
jgi:hypothetical protein